MKVHIIKRFAKKFVPVARELGFTVSVTQETSPGWFDLDIRGANVKQIALIAKASSTPPSALFTTDLRPLKESL